MIQGNHAHDSTLISNAKGYKLESTWDDDDKKSTYEIPQRRQ